MSDGVNRQNSIHTGSKNIYYGQWISNVMLVPLENFLILTRMVTCSQTTDIIEQTEANSRN